MAKRIRLKDIIAGAAMKEVNATILSGDAATLLSGNATEMWSDLYIAGQQGNLLLSPTVSSDSVLYNIGFFDRMYSVENPDLYSNGANLQVMATDSDVIDSIQFGDYAFLLTNPTTLGTKYCLSSNITTYIDDVWYREPHKIVTYVPGTSSSEIDLYIGNIDFNITPERPDIVYGIISGNSLWLYVKDLSGTELEANTVYTLSGGVPDSLPFNYLMEQPLNYSVKFNRAGLVYGDITGDITVVYTPPSATMSGSNDLYSPYANEDDPNKIYVNPFQLKNMYDYNWQNRIDHSRQMITGIRNYVRVGKTQNTIWLAYKYFVEGPTTIVQEFELVERVKGLYKFRANDGHKSNIYSIRIKNSGLNELLTNSYVKTKIRGIIEETVHTAVKKIAPSHTQLWKVIWEGL